MRGSNRVTDQDPEGKYEALQKYGRDLTVAAREGKLDPVRLPVSNGYTLCDSNTGSSYLWGDVH